MWVEEKISVPDWQGIKVSNGGNAIGSCDDSLAEITAPKRVVRHESKARNGDKE
jgi:hypothetical protein